MLATIRKNSKGDLVRVAQYLTGSDTVNTTAGVFTDAFAEEVENWQKAHGLTADGIIGQNTWAAIAQNAPTVRYGSKGNAVSRASTFPNGRVKLTGQR